MRNGPIVCARREKASFRALSGLAAILGASAASASHAGGEPSKVSAQVVTTGKLYVGQAIEIKLDAAMGEGPAEITSPRVAEGDGEVRQVSAGRFVAIARRPGTLVIPPFRVRSGERTGASRSIRVSVENPPMAGRSPAFLGGVGPFEVHAEAGTPRLRLGESLEYRIAIAGSAAWGSARPPGLEDWASSLPGLRIEAIPMTLEGGDPAVRTFRYRLRPGRAGKWVLPPVTVAAFDPKAARYATRVAPGVPIEVEDVPRFDPARLDYGAGRPVAETRRARVWAGAAVALAVATAILGGRILRRRGRTSGPRDPRKLALELIRGLTGGDDRAEAARSVVEALATFLREVGGRSPGVLTPPEASEDVERLTLDRGLAEDARRLVEDCDRARFGGTGDDPAELTARGREFLGRLGNRAGSRAGEGGPREAVETAKI